MIFSLSFKHQGLFLNDRLKNVCGITAPPPPNQTLLSHIESQWHIGMSSGSRAGNLSSNSLSRVILHFFGRFQNIQPSVCITHTKSRCNKSNLLEVYFYFTSFTHKSTILNSSLPLFNSRYMKVRPAPGTNQYSGKPGYRYPDLESPGSP